MSQIDERPFIQLMYASVSEVSSEPKAKDILGLIKTSVRCACLLDLYAETEDPIFLREFETQRKKFYSLVPEQFHRELQTLEIVVNNWNQIENYIFKWFSVLKSSPLALNLATIHNNSFQ